MRKVVLVGLQLAAILGVAVVVVGCESQMFVTFEIQNTGVQPVRVFRHFYDTDSGEWGTFEDFVQVKREEFIESEYGEKKPGGVDNRGNIEVGDSQNWTVRHGNRFRDEDDDRWAFEARTIDGEVVCRWEFVRREIVSDVRYTLDVTGCVSRIKER